jgi:hypothetical protein
VVSSTLYRLCLWEDLDFPDLTRASDIGSNLQWFTIVAIIPQWVGSYICLFGPYMDSGPLYWLPLLDGVILSTLCGAGMAFDRAPQSL